MSFSRLLAVLACTLAVAVAGVAPAVGGTAATSRAADVPAVAAKSCSSGYVHAVMPDGSHKCLRAGQFCSRKRAWQRVYHSKGFHCKLNRHLTYY
jgi:hypothetical protein